MELNELPSKVVFVGGGYISFEFAHVAARAGANVTILHQGARPLNNFDPYLVDMLVQRTRDLDIDIHLQTKVEGIESSKANCAISPWVVIIGVNSKDSRYFIIDKLSLLK